MAHLLKWILPLAAACASPVLAENTPIQVEGSTISTRVYVGDLNLRNASDVRRLNRRVYNAAETTCLIVNPDLNLSVMALRYPHALPACRSDSIAAAQPQIQDLMARAGTGAMLSWLTVSSPRRAR